MKRCTLSLPVLAALLMAGCGDSASKEDEPATPQEMYARVQELLKPNAEREGPDTAGALHWLTRAAEAGLLQAQTDLGGLYLEGGKGVARDGKKALEWFTRAAEQGHASSYIFMGRILYFGIDVQPDPEQAMAYWQKAAEADIPEAYFYMGGAMVREEATAAAGVECLKRAATEGKGRIAASAATLLGSIYNKGLGEVKADAAVSAAWYRAGAKAGSPKAQLVYALMLLSGTSFEKNEKEGMAHLRMAAGQDYPQAIAVLINILRNGENADANEAEAAAWEKRLESLRSTPQAAE